MAIYRLSSKSISRGKGQSAVASAAYRAGEKLTDHTIEKTFDYERKQHIDGAEILLPENAPERLLDRETLWNEAEKADTRKNSEVAKEYQLAIPNELALDAKKALVRDFAQKTFVEKGLAVDIAFHNLEKENPHAHVMTTTRSITPEGLGQKERFFKAAPYLTELRKDWEVHLNKTLELNGIESSVTCKSYADMGLEIEGISTSLKREAGEIDTLLQKERNGEKLIENSGQIADALTHHKASFKLKDIERFVERHSVPDQHEQIVAKLFEHENFITLDSEKGVFTSATYLNAEKDLFGNIDTLNNIRPDKKEISFEKVAEVSREMTLSEKQQNALVYAVNEDSQVKNIIGLAGSGKSYTMKAIAKVYEQAGYDCKGVALSGIVADNMAKDAEIEDSKTIASFLKRYEMGKEQLSKDSVLFIDEASLVGVDQYQKISEIVKENDAKMISIGDNAQLQAIQAGGAYRGVIEMSSHIELDTIQRQQEDGDRKATYDLSTDKVIEGLTHYYQQGHFNEHQNNQSLQNSIVQNYFDSREQGKSHIIMAHKRKTVEVINKVIHQQLSKSGELGLSHQIKGKEYSVGDRFVFLKNDYSLDVRNGTTGIIEHINEQGEMQIKSDDGRTINFNAKEYEDFAHGYAITIHKAQGVTVDQAQLYLDKDVTSNLALVGASRHKESVEIHYLQQSKTNPHGLKDFEHLVKCAERKEVKELVKGYNTIMKNNIEEKSPEIKAINDKERTLEVKDLTDSMHRQQEIKAYTQELKELRAEKREVNQELRVAEHREMELSKERALKTYQAMKSQEKDKALELERGGFEMSM